VRFGYILSGIDHRARVAGVFLFITFLFLVLVFVRFQLLKSMELRLKSDENRLRVLPLMPPRGVILDRNGKIMADNRPFYSVSLLPGPKDLLERELYIIARVFPEAHLDVPGILDQVRSYSAQPIRILERVATEALAVLEEHREMLPGLKIQSEPLRYYPFPEACSHVIGYVGKVSQQEVNGAGWREFRVGDYVGRSGIESRYDELLRGKWGASYFEVDVKGREVGPYKGKELDKPLSGEYLTLTIDLDLQLAAHELFPEEGRGAVVCIDPRNGEIRALYSKPTFDPNHLSRGLSSEMWKAISRDPTSPLLNRTIQSAYPPGSTFKTVTAVAAMEKGIFRDNLPECVCYGGMYFGRRWFGCWKEGGHGHVGFIQGFAQSCDVYFYKLGIKVGLEDLTQSAMWLNLGTATGIDLPGEVGGLIPSTQWYDNTYGTSNWGRGVIMNLSIGQGELLVTPTQLARIYSVIANGGKLVTPRLTPVDGEEVEASITFSDMNGMSLLSNALVEAVNGESGTGRMAISSTTGEIVSGKTGTAQNPHGEDHALFVGFAPSEDPEILCVVIVEESGHGGSVAAPIVGRLLERYFSSRSSFTADYSENAEDKKGSQRES
jgi:penicillin-binding protein 2